MKQLIIIFFLLASITASAQVDTMKVRQFINAYGYQYKNAAIDSSLRIPRDTFKLRKSDSGSIAYKSGQTWLWNGVNWILSSGSGGGIGTATAPIAITGSNVAINYKTDGLQVEGTSLAAKSKVFKTQAELRALTLLDTGVVYMTVIGKRVLPFVYSSTETAPDDSARVITTAGGKLVQDLGGILTPEQFGAIGDGVADDFWPFQKISNYIGTKSGTIECNGRATYKFSQAVTIQGAIGNLEQFIVNGNGAIFTGARIFQRRPVDNTAAINETSRRIIIRHCNFRSTTTTGSLALEIGATYSSVVSNNTFQAYDTAVAFKFGLSSRTEMNQFIQNRNSIIFMNGDWTGVTLANSQSNSSMSFQDRIFNLTGTPRSVAILGASGCIVDGVIIEGASPLYGIYFSSIGSTVAAGFTVRNAHIEVATGRAGIYLQPNGGQYVIENVFQQLADTLITVERQGGNPVIKVSRIQNVLISKFVNTSNSAYWNFSDMIATWDYNSTFVTTGGYVLPTVVNEDPGGVKVGSAVGLKSATNNTVALGGSNFTVNANIIASPTNTWTWGLSSLRPANIHSGNVYALNTGVFGFSQSGGTIDGTMSMPTAGNFSFNGTSSIIVPRGDDAARPTGVNGMIRYSTTSGSFEGFASGAWGALGAGGGGGGVSAISIASANGFSGTSSGGATPVLTIAAGAITPTSVTASGVGTFGGANGFTVGSLASAQRITYGLAATNTFAFVTAANGTASIQALDGTFTGNGTFGGNILAKNNASIGGSAGDYATFGHNINFTTTSGTYTYRVTGDGSFAKFESGGFKLYSFPSGTAGTSVTGITNPFTVTSAGNGTFTGSLTASSATISGAISAGTLTASGIVTATSFIKSGGTASQFQMADGSTATVGSGLSLSGGVLSATGSGGGTAESFVNVADADYSVPTGAGNYTVTWWVPMTADRACNLPSASGNNGKVIWITNGGAGSKNVIFNTPVYQNVTSSYTTLGPGGWVRLYSDGTNWVISAKN